MQIIGSEKFIEKFIEKYNELLKSNKYTFIGFFNGKKIFIKN